MNIEKTNHSHLIPALSPHGAEREKIEKPRKIMVPLAEGLAWRGGGKFRFEEKMDGRFAWRRGENWLVVGELLAGRRRAEGGGRKADENAHLISLRMASTRQAPALSSAFGGTSGGKCGDFYAFDCLIYMGSSIAQWPLRERLRALDDVCASPEGRSFLRPAVGNGGEFLEAVLAHGGEGVVAKVLDAPYGEMWACKRLETFYCVVTGFNGGMQSVKIGILRDWSPDGVCEVSIQGCGSVKMNRGLRGLTSGKIEPEISISDCGSARSGSAFARGYGAIQSAVALFGGKCDKVRVGSIIKVEGFGLTASGKIREPRVCKDTATSWLVKY